MIEIIRKDTGEVCITADPGGVFSTHAKLLTTRKELNTYLVSVVSTDTWDYLCCKYEVETITISKEKETE